MVRKSQRRTRLSVEALESRNLLSGAGPDYGMTVHYVTPDPTPILAGVQVNPSPSDTGGVDSRLIH